MRRTTVGLVVLAAILFCTLIAGTPVNNDPSPQAERAGIHLTTVSTMARAGVATTVAAVGLRLAILTIAMAAIATTLVRRRRSDVEKPPRELLRSRAGDRRGPPALAI